MAQVTAVARHDCRLQDLVADPRRSPARSRRCRISARTPLEKQAEDRATIEELNELLFKQNQREIANMREAVTFGVESSAVSAGRRRPAESAPPRVQFARRRQVADASRDDLIAMIDEQVASRR